MKSKKRSGSSSPEPPEPLTFFVDRSLGRGVAKSLKAEGANTEYHDDHFANSALDVEWLPAVAAKEWIVLTADKRLRFRRIEREVLLASGVRAFVLASGGHLTGEEMAAIFLRHLPKMGLSPGNILRLSLPGLPNPMFMSINCPNSVDRYGRPIFRKKDASPSTNRAVS